MKKDHLSYSQLTTYTRCAKAYELQRIQKAPEVPAVYLVAGKAVHTAIERINREYAERMTSK